MPAEIRVLRPTETVLFAASELARYLRLMSETPVDFRIAVTPGPGVPAKATAAKRPTPTAVPAFTLGLLADVVPKGDLGSGRDARTTSRRDARATSEAGRRDARTASRRDARTTKAGEAAGASADDDTIFVDVRNGAGVIA